MKKMRWSVCVYVDYINLAQDGKKLQVLVNTVMNLWIP